MFDFIQDLDAYFCERYANYDTLCGLSGYQMPTMQATKTDDFGRTVAYTLPSNTMRLALQPNKDELLKSLKEKLLDKTFSFSFRPYGFFEGLKLKFSRYAFHKHLKAILAKHGITTEDTGKNLAIDTEIWKNIVKGNFEPSKNLILSIALAEHLTFDETKSLLYSCGFEFDFSIVKDIVVAYLLENKVFNRDMIEAALVEYKVTNLFLN